MSQFVVSARKYRPNRFEDVVGQEHVSQTLKNALQSNHLAHAFLFTGPRGVGKTTCARILAKVLNCQNVGPDFEPCNTCDSCRAFNENASFNITELDAASNNSVEHIRALIEQVRFQPQQGKYKVFIIDEVHMLSQQAFNAFLKTLEEPPPYAIFILATTEKHKIIPTILSRCQIFDFRRIQISDIAAHLEGICRQEGIEAESEALHIIAQKADGALRDALSIFDRIVSFSGKQVRYADVISNLNVLDYDYYFRLVDALLLRDSAQILLLFDDVLRKGFEGDIFLNGLADHLRELLVAKDPATVSLLETTGNLRDRYLQQAALAPSSFLLTSLNLAGEADVHYKAARNKRLLIELTLLKMAFIHQAITLQPETPPAEEKKKPITRVEPQAAPPPPKETKPQPAPVFSLHALDQEVAGELGKEPETLPELEPAEVQRAWDQYLTTLQSETTRAVLQSTELRIEADKIVVVVGSTFAEKAVIHEQGLMEHLRRELRRPDLVREVRIDPERARANQPPPKKKPLTVKEKYLQMVEHNPLLARMREQFDLAPDGD